MTTQIDRTIRNLKVARDAISGLNDDEDILVTLSIKDAKFKIATLLNHYECEYQKTHTIGAYRGE